MAENMTPGLVSTIIPVYNRPAQLQEAVASVLAQDWRPVEVIIVDDGSTDGATLPAAQALAAAHPGVVRVVTQANGGPGVAREHGRQLAHGEFIQYLDSDDLLLPGKFSAQVRGLRADPLADISYGLTLASDGSGEQGRPTHSTDRARASLIPQVFAGRIWPTLSPLYRRRLCDAIGAWSPTRVLEDWDYDCRAALLCNRLHYVAEPVAVVRYHNGDHAGRAWQANPQAMRDRVNAYVRVLGYAQQAGCTNSLPVMRQLVRSMFWMAREAGACGLAVESRQLFELSRTNADPAGLDYRAYRMLAGLLGWVGAGRLSRVLEKWR